MPDEEFRPGEDYIDTVKNMNALHDLFNKLYFNIYSISCILTVS